MKTNLDRYPHYSDAHRNAKFKALRTIYGNGAEGWAMEGRFWALNNLIAVAENCVLNLSTKIKRASVADELGLSLAELDQFIDILKSDDVDHLIDEIKPGFYSTEIVQETFQTVYKDRVKARDRKNKSVGITGSGENYESSGELLESSPDANNKGKGKEKESISIEENSIVKKRKVEDPLFWANFSEKIKSLFVAHTKFSDPSESLHIEPIMQIFNEHFRENMTDEIIYNCMKKKFAQLDPTASIRIDYLTTNIITEITKESERLFEESKAPERKEAAEFRKRSEMSTAESIKADNESKLRTYSEFVKNNRELFKNKEILELDKYFQAGNVLSIGRIVLPKMESIEL